MPNRQICHYLFSPFLFQGLAPARSPTSIIACVAVGLPMKTKLMIRRILRAKIQFKSPWLPTAKMQPTNISTVESVSPLPAACMRV